MVIKVQDINKEEHLKLRRTHYALLYKNLRNTYRAPLFTLHFKKHQQGKSN